jgi:predicted nuclease with RNAse H fold
MARVLAIDWSGAAGTASRQHIWLAESVEPGLVSRLESGRDRAQLTEYLLSLAPRDTVVGLDFAFSFPDWFLTGLGVRSGPELWAYAAEHGEAWLERCAPPFWGRPGRSRPLTTPEREWRGCELSLGRRPKSIFQIGGAGSVGTGSIRGMPLLRRLWQAGATIWPFVRAGWPVVVEIYPRLLTGPVHKSSAAARAEYLSHNCLGLTPVQRQAASSCEDAFDAAVSALRMSDFADDLVSLPWAVDPTRCREGRIWHPDWRSDPI